MPSPTPTTLGRPRARVTTAACEVEPPRSVTTARAAIIPLTSSGLVVGRVRTTSTSASQAASESSTATPAATPGQAAMPLATTSAAAAAAAETRGASTRRQLLGRHSLERLGAVDRALAGQVDGGPHGRLRRAFRGARLEQPQRAALHRELDVLGRPGRRRRAAARSPAVASRRPAKRLQHRLERQRVERARDDVLALPARQPLAVVLLAGAPVRVPAVNITPVPERSSRLPNTIAWTVTAVPPPSAAIPRSAPDSARLGLTSTTRTRPATATSVSPLPGIGRGGVLAPLPPSLNCSSNRRRVSAAVLVRPGRSGGSAALLATSSVIPRFRIVSIIPGMLVGAARADRHEQRAHGRRRTSGRSPPQAGDPGEHRAPGPRLRARRRRRGSGGTPRSAGTSAGGTGRPRLSIQAMLRPLLPTTSSLGTVRPSRTTARSATAVIARLFARRPTRTRMTGDHRVGRRTQGASSRSLPSIRKQVLMELEPDRVVAVDADSRHPFALRRRAPCRRRRRGALYRHRGAGSSAAKPSRTRSARSCWAPRRSITPVS